MVEDTYFKTGIQNVTIKLISVKYLILFEQQKNSPTGDSGAKTLPHIGSAFMYLKTTSSGHGSNVFCSFERIDIIQISSLTFYYNRFSILTGDKLKSLGRFRAQLLLEGNTWSTRYNTEK